MPHLFELSAPWWVFVLRATVIYLLVMLLVRISGKRAIGQLTPLDLVLLILIGNAVQNGINGGDNSLTGAAVMATTLIALNYAVAYATSHSKRIERLVCRWCLPAMARCSRPCCGASWSVTTISTKRCGWAISAASRTSGSCCWRPMAISP